MQMAVFRIRSKSMLDSEQPTAGGNVENEAKKDRRSTSFLCDIYCGDGHDEMNGVIFVND
jgi:hypothetical protein